MNFVSSLIVWLLDTIYYSCIKRIPYTFNNYFLSRVAGFFTKGAAVFTINLASFLLSSSIFFKEIFNNLRNYWR